MTPNVKDYTTEELERLTTLTDMSMRTGEYVINTLDEARTTRRNERIWLMTQQKDEPKLVQGNGHTGTRTAWPARRVTSFTDPTELDPPQEVMLAELKRRKEPPISNATHAGRRVRYVYNGKTGIVASTSLRAAMDAYWPCTAKDEVAWVCDAGRAQGCRAAALELLHD